MSYLIGDLLSVIRAKRIVSGLWEGRCPICWAKITVDRYRSGRTAVTCRHGCSDARIATFLSERGRTR